MDGVHVLKGWTDPAMPSSAHPDTECQVVDGSHFFPYDTWRHLSKNSFQCLLNAFYTSFVSYLKWKIITTRGVSTKKDLAPCIVNQVTWHLVCGSGQWRQTQQSMALACPSFWEVNKTRIVLVVVNKAFFSCCPSFLLCQLPLHNSAFSQYIKRYVITCYMEAISVNAVWRTEPFSKQILQQSPHLNTTRTHQGFLWDKKI